MRAFDAIIANPPFSLRSGPLGPDPRAFGGVPQAKRGNFAVQHMVSSMNAGTGCVGVLMLHGVLLRTIQIEQVLRDASRNRLGPPAS